MLKVFPYLLVLVVLATSGCQKEEETPITNQTLLFGLVYDMCDLNRPECSQLYYLTGTTLEEETSNERPRDNGNTWVYTNRSASDHAVALPVLQQIPAQLLQEPEGEIGQPNWYDQGYYYVKYTDQGVTKVWYVDTDLANVPAYLHPYLTSMRQTLNQLF